VRNSSPPWFGGEGAASLRTPNCRRALGLLLLDWSVECSTTPLVLSRDPVCQGSCLRWFVRGAETAPNEPNARPCATGPRLHHCLRPPTAHGTAPPAPCTVPEKTRWPAHLTTFIFIVTCNFIISRAALRLGENTATVWVYMCVCPQVGNLSSVALRVV
jgi:hypothetical protein